MMSAGSGGVNGLPISRDVPGLDGVGRTVNGHASSRLCGRTIASGFI
jgi:hypothetical protein